MSCKYMGQVLKSQKYGQSSQLLNALPNFTNKSNKKAMGLHWFSIYFYFKCTF